MDYKSKYNILLIFSIVLIVGLVFQAYYNIPERPTIVVVKHTAANIEDADTIATDSITVDKFLAFADSINLKFPEVVLAQALLESGHFKSNIYVSNNNIFGMKMPRSRVTVATTAKNGYAYFKDWRMCVIDYAIYQSRYLSRYKTESSYITALGNVYAEDVRYSQKITSIVKKLKSKEV